MVDGNEIMDCRNDLIDLMNSPSGFVEQEGRLCKFHPHATLGFSIYFDYDKTKTMAVNVICHTQNGRRRALRANTGQPP